MNRQIRRLGLSMLVLYTGLFLMLNWVQVIKADEYNDNPNNTREILRDFSGDRGQILSADDAVLARTVPSNDRFEKQREYPEGDLFGHVTGYFAFNLGATGLEKSYNDELAGQTFELEVKSIRDLFVDRTRVADVTISIRKDVQQIARDQLGPRPGAVVALDPKTGAVLALWSFPSYDPNLLATHDLEKADAVGRLLGADAGRPLVARTYREDYFPGSTFKVVTGSAGLESGKVTPEQPVYPTESSYTPPLTNTPVRNFGGGTCGGNLFEILRVSCNTAFARMGVETVGADALVGTAEAYGWGSRPPLDVNPTAVPSRIPEPAFFEQNDPVLAQVAFGQNAVRATPLQMALVAAAVANKGQVMQPKLMSEIRDSDGEVVEEADPKRWRTAMSEANAETMRQAMINVAQRGTATGLQIPGMEVGGKTGTAQLGTEPPSSHAWIIGFAGPPGGEAQVAVAVIVEGQPGASEQTGGRVAAPIAKAVMERILQVRAEGQAP